jgi:hypothetical protein
VPTFVARWSIRVFALALTFAVAACGDSGGSGGAEPTEESSAALFTNDLTACNYFVAKGLTNFQAAGIVGNLDQESGASPTAVQSGGPGRGIAQWSVGGRWDHDANDNATAYASQHGQSVWALGLQLDFIWYELTTFSGYGLASLRATSNVTDATVVFQNRFEGCGTCIQTQRINYAKAVLAQCASAPPPPPPPPPDNPPKGYVDSAACAGIAGWAQDPDAPSMAIDVDFYFNGPAGAAGTEAMRVLANVHRPDLCTAIGSCDHGYSFELPLGMQDGKAHPVHAYGIDVSGGANPELADSPKTFSCPNARPPLDVHSGVKRHVVDPASMTAWAFSMLHDVAPEPDAVVAAYPTGAD